PNLKMLKDYCLISPLEERLLRSPECPIVLLKRQPGTDIANNVAPGNPYLGAFLPYTPLHHLLLAEIGRPVVATSGNLSDEPICIDEQEALGRLQGIADWFLVHNRPIQRHADDSIARIIAGREVILRRARGYAPLPILIPQELPPTLAVGAHLKNTVAIAHGNRVFISQHIGDLETEAAYNAFRNVIDSLQQLYEVQPEQIVCDAHPDYLSTQYAMESHLPVTTVQHHAAHIFSCMAENELTPPVLGISWDGTGYGLDGTVWGGEFILVTESGWERIGHLRTFSLPGGEKAVKEPRRSALGLLYELAGDRVFDTYPLPCWSDFTEAEKKLLLQMLRKGINSPRTSSMGRLFDAVAAICGLHSMNRFEGQAAMELEFSIPEEESDAAYRFDLVPEKKAGKNVTLLIDWGKMIDDLLTDVQAHLPVGEISRKFHNTLTEVIVAVAKRTAIEKVALSGGCFQNKYLSERAIQRLSEEGFQPYFHQRVPPNDGGISLGQAAGGGMEKEKGKG
ncbi:MAG: carbamoyltransferase HypF, partial [Calditrichaeota bacterium]